MLRTFRLHLRFVVITIFVFAVAIGEAADVTIEKFRQDVFGSWVVDVDGDARTRTLNIKGAEKKRDGVWVLDATFGWSDARQTTVKAELVVKPDGYSLELTTQSNALITADYGGADSFTGTFTSTAGKAKPVRLDRLSSEEASKRAAKQLEAAMKTGVPGPDVPADCASMFGGWTGHWGVHGGEQWLWVVSVDANCIAKYQIGRMGYRGPFKTAEIKKGVLSTSGADNGTIYWERHGDDLWARYQGPQGQTNAVHKKIAFETK